MRGLPNPCSSPTIVAQLVVMNGRYELLVDGGLISILIPLLEHGDRAEACMSAECKKNGYTCAW